MEFKEVKVAKLDKDDAKLLREVMLREHEAREIVKDWQREVEVLWRYFVEKYSLYSGRHFMKKNCIYKKVLEVDNV